MKEIQDDIVPFGFIDDGESHKNDLDNRENPWHKQWYNADEEY